MKTVVVQVHAGEPADISLCPRCSHVALCVFPVTGLAESGVVPMGSVPVCAECGSVEQAVRDFMGQFRDTDETETP
jgi:hypothetical protein